MPTLDLLTRLMAEPGVMMDGNPGENAMWDREEEWDNIQKGWLNSGQEKLYYDTQAVGFFGMVILVLVVYLISQFF